MSGTLKLNDTVFATENNGVITTDASTIKVGGTTVIDSNRKMTGVDIVPTSSMMFRNKIINGGMQIDQRNAGASVGPFASASAGYKGVDRWFIASDPMTSQQITGNTPTGFSHYLKLTKGSGSNIDIRQTVELPAAGQAGQFDVGSVWTLSFYAKSVAGGETLNFSSYFRIGVATGTFTAVSAPTPSSITLTTNWTRYSVLFTIDVSPGASDLCIAFGLNTTATELHLTGVQLEEGSVATPFEHRPYGLELSLCQRYFEKSYNIEDTPGTSTYNGIHTNGGYYSMPASNYGTRPHTSYKVTKRGSTTVKTYDSAGNLGKCNYPDSVTNQSFTVIHSGQSGFSAETSTLSGGTDGRCYWQWTVESEL